MLCETTSDFMQEHSDYIIYHTRTSLSRVRMGEKLNYIKCVKPVPQKILSDMTGRLF